MDDDKNAARNAIIKAETIVPGEPYQYYIWQSILAIAKTLWLIAMILLSINNKLKK